MELNRREIVLGGLAAVATGVGGLPAEAATSYFAGTAVDNGVTYKKTNFAKIDKQWHKQIVKYKSSEPAGTIVVDTIHHFLYLVIENQTAIRYGVGDSAGGELGGEHCEHVGRSCHRHNKDSYG